MQKNGVMVEELGKPWVTVHCEDPVHVAHVRDCCHCSGFSLASFSIFDLISQKQSHLANGRYVQSCWRALELSCQIPSGVLGCFHV